MPRTRSLFSPFASGVNYGAAHNLGGLFRPSLEINPEFLALLQPGPQPDNSLLMSTKPFRGRGGIFGGARRLEDEANANYLLPLIQAQFGSNLALQKEKELIPFRSATETQQRKDLYDYEQKAKKQLEEEELSKLGQVQRKIIASFTPEQGANIIPGSITEDAEIARGIAAKFGDKMPLNKALVEANPQVVQARTSQAMGEGWIRLGSGDLYNPLTNQIVEGPSTTEETTKSQVATGEMETYLDEASGEARQRPVYKEQLRTTRQNIPARTYDLRATQASLDAIPKESGATNNTVIQAQPASEPLNFNAPIPNLEAVARIPNILNQLNTNLKQPAPQIKAQPVTSDNFSGNIRDNFMRDVTKVGKKMGYLPEEKEETKKEEPKPKQRAKSYPFDYLIDSLKMDEKQTSMFENLIEGYRKQQKKEPSLEEARTFARIAVGNKK